MSAIADQTICSQCPDDQVQPSDVQVLDYFGTGLSIDGSFAIVGASTADGTSVNEGKAYIYEPIQGVWNQGQTLRANFPQGKEMLGESAAISGDIALIAAPRYDAVPGSVLDSGRVLAFRRDPLASSPQWDQEAAFTEGNDAGTGHFFGGRIAASHQGVAVDGNIAVIGAPGSNGYGRAYIFTYDPVTGQWDHGVMIELSNPSSNDDFGFAVAISGRQVIIGAPGRGDDGAAYVYHKDTSTQPPQWVLDQELSVNVSGVVAQFGWSVAIDGDDAVVGANDADKAYVYARDQSGWNLVTPLSGSDTVAGDDFGSAVGVSSGIVVVGARNDFEFDTTPGSAYVFRRSGDPEVPFEEMFKMLGPEDAADLGDRIGEGVAIDGDTAFVGASGDEPPNAGNTQSGVIYILNDLPNCDADPCDP